MHEAILSNLRRLYHHKKSGGTLRAEDISRVIVEIEKLQQQPDMPTKIADCLENSNGYIEVDFEEALDLGMEFQTYTIDRCDDSTTIMRIAPAADSPNTDPMHIVFGHDGNVREISV